MNKNLPYVSVIVPVYNGESTIQRCLDSLVNLDYPKEKLEIIVVDNNSTDNTEKIIKQYPVIYVFEEKRNRSRTRNKGIELSTGKIICFLDADCSAHPDWVKNIIKGFNGENIGACGGRTLPYRPKTWVEKYLGYSYSKFENFSKKGWFFAPHIDTANAAYSRYIFEEVGLFDETLLYNEDLEFSWRICLNGYQVRYIPEAIVYRKYVDNLGKFCIRFFHSGCDTVKVVKKYEQLLPFSNNPLVDIVYGMHRWMGKPLVNFFAKKHKQQRVFFLLEMVHFVMPLLGFGYGWLRMKIKEEKTCPIFLEVRDKKICWDINDKATILDLQNACYYDLNESGNTIWKMVKAGKTLSEIVDLISQKYQISKVNVQTDVCHFVDTLKKTKLL